MRGDGRGREGILLAKSRYRQTWPSLDKQMGSDERGVEEVEDNLQDGTRQVNVRVEQTVPHTVTAKFATRPRLHDHKTTDVVPSTGALHNPDT